MSDIKLGEVYFRDHHGNFHKLSTRDFNQELSELSNFDSIIKSSKFTVHDCNYKPYYYNLLELETINKCPNIDNNQLKLDKGLYKFTINLNINSCFDQNIYFFFRNHNVVSESLHVNKINNKIPNNLSFNFILYLDTTEKLEIAVLSEKELQVIKSYILFVKLN